MASTDARPVPRKNVAFRYYFAIRKNDGTLITTWAGADSEVSLDGAAFSDCTNEATEIGTTGCGYIDFTSAEMNADCVVYKLTVTNTSALPIVVTLFPEESGDYRSDVTMLGGDAQSATDLKDFADAGYDPSTNKVQGVVLVDTSTNLTNLPAISSNWLTADGLAADAVTEIQSGLSTLTQTQVTGGAYALNSASFAFNAALDFTTTQKAATLARVTLVDTTTTNTDLVTANSIADQVWDEVLSGHLTAGSTGNALNAAGSAGDPWSTSLPGAYGAGSAGYIIGTNLNATIGSRSTQTSVDDLPTNAELATALGTADDAVLAAIAGLNNITADAVWAVGTRTITGGTITTYTGNTPQTADVAALITTVGVAGAGLTAADDAVIAAIAALNNLSAAQVNSEVVDAMATDTYAEPGQGAPGATISLAAKINYLYKYLRNKKTQTSTENKVYADDGTTVDHKSTTSDDGTTTTFGEQGTGP